MPPKPSAHGSHWLAVDTFQTCDVKAEGKEFSFDQLKEGMLLVPENGRVWLMTSRIDSKLSFKRIYTVSRSSYYLDNSSHPAIYLGKIKFETKVYGLRTFHKILYDGHLCLTDGYEFSRGIEPL